MDLTLGPEQEAVRDAIRSFLADRMPMTRVRAVMGEEPGIDADVWREAAGLGWLALALPESSGGAGYGLPEAMLLFVELGRALVPGPWLGSVLAADALAGVPALRNVHAQLLAGTHRVAVIDDPADALGTGGSLTGEARGIADGGLVGGFLVLGATNVRYVKREGLDVAVEPSMDPTRRLARVRFSSAPAQVVSDRAEALRHAGTVLAAAEAVGVAERALETSVAYAKVREQFGKPIGSFQAIKHRCADMAVRTEVARSAVTWAAVAVRDGLPDAAFHVHVAKTLATGAALTNATDNVQNHGGMGYTWEADAHLYLKRARLLEHTFGTRTAHLDTIAAPWRAAP
jgi:alkylation response protein AidB-like acyl-CoA dehydrogenase